MAGICIVTSIPVCRNPRVFKEAETLANADYEVTVIRPILSDELAAEEEQLLKGRRWRCQTSIDLRRDQIGCARRFALRAKNKCASLGVQWSGLQLVDALGYGFNETFKHIKRTKYDLTLAHLEIGMYVAHQLAKEGRRVGVDFEDWYSRDLLPLQQKRRPLRLIERSESYLLRSAKHVTTTSHSLALALAEAHRCQPPKVIYNCFPWADRARMTSGCKHATNGEKFSLHWFSQTIGEGRGIETLLASLQEVPNPVDVHLRGVVDERTKQRLRDLMPKGLGHELRFLKSVSNPELLSCISEHDIGLALEPTKPDNKNLTVSNKILHYLLAGLAVVASNTAGQVEIHKKAPEAIRLFESQSPKQLAKVLNQMLSDRAGLARAKAAAVDAARLVFCWEKQAPVLLESIAHSLVA